MPTSDDKKTRIDPFGTTIIEDYNHLYEEFGIRRLRPLLDDIPNPSIYLRRNVVFGHRDFKRVLDAMNNHQDYAVMSGIKPTGEFHLGTLMTAQEVVYFQKEGATAFYCIADVEAYEDNDVPFESSQKFAVGNVADLLALGFNPKKGYIYQQSKERRVQDLAIIFGRGATLATMKAIYGERHIGLYLSALIQAGDILMPQLADFGGPKPTVVPVGVDQDPHLRLTRDLASKFRRKYHFIPPSSTVHKIMKGLDGSPKMSKRNPTSYFTLHENPEEVANKISNAFTGGKPTVEEQKKLGGIPEICPIYELDMYQFEEDDEKVKKTYLDCKSGRLLCGEHKSRTIEIVLRFIQNHKKKRRKFIDEARDILRNSGK